MFNNSYTLFTLDEDYHVPPQPQRTPIKSVPCLPLRLPSTGSFFVFFHEITFQLSLGFISREANKVSHGALRKELEYQQSNPFTSDTPLADEQASPKTTRRQSSASDTTNSVKSSTIPSNFNSLSTNWREPQAFEIFRAIERKDIVFLMEIRYNLRFLVHNV